MNVKWFFPFLLLLFSCNFSADTDRKSDKQKEYEKFGYDVVTNNEFFASQKAENLTKKGVDLGLEGKYEEAEKIFQKALKEEPENPVILNNIGLSLYNRELFNEAIVFYEKALEVSDSTSLMAASNLGLTYYQQMDYGRALKILNFVLEKSKNDNSAKLIARLHRLLVNIELEDCNEIRKDRKAIENLRYNNQLGDFTEEIEQLDKEIKELCTTLYKNNA